MLYASMIGHRVPNSCSSFLDTLQTWPCTLVSGLRVVSAAHPACTALSEMQLQPSMCRTLILCTSSTARDRSANSQSSALTLDGVGSCTSQSPWVCQDNSNSMHMVMPRHAGQASGKTCGQTRGQSSGQHMGMC